MVRRTTDDGADRRAYFNITADTDAISHVLEIKVAGYKGTHSDAVLTQDGHSEALTGTNERGGGGHNETRKSQGGVRTT